MAENKEFLEPREISKRKRERILILVVAVLFALTTYFEIRLSYLSNRLPFVNSIFFFGLINFNIVLLMVLVFLLFRNIGKIFLERRRNVLGAKLKTKLVIAFFLFTVIPTTILFLISSLYINSSFDKWFSIKIQNTLQAALEITQTYYKNTSRVASHLATQVATDLAKEDPQIFIRKNQLKNYLKKQLETPTVDAIEVYTDPTDDRVVDIVKKSEVEIPRLPMDVMLKGFSGEKETLIQHLLGADLIRAVAPVEDINTKKVNAIVAVTFAIPASLVNRVDEISNVFEDYKEVNPLNYPVKSTYFIILLMMTLLIIFVSIWIGIYLARELTVPLEKLVRGTKKIAEGDLDFEIINPGSDEIATLTSSFNTMTSEIKKQRLQLEQTNKELLEKNTYVEALLNKITAGVISVDHRGIITTINPQASKLLQIQVEACLGKSIDEVFPHDKFPFSELLQHINPNTSRASLSDTGMLMKQFSVGKDDDYKTLVVSASVFSGGVVFVIDDTTYITKVQRETAWREVARRIAHEIKNPLTPIKLSAQRLQRKFSDLSKSEGQVLQECTNTIIKNVDELRDMVNEFSNFARFPSANPKPNNLNEAIKEIVVLYKEAHCSISFIFNPEERLPIFAFDRDQIKRVIINLFDNAVSALSEFGTSNKKEVPQIKVATHYNEQLKIAVIEVEDNGPGVAENVRNRMFEPYFSTKSTGTGLGLAIVKRIISDHNGFIRVQSNYQQGTKFIIELPIDILDNASVNKNLNNLE